MKPKVNQTSLTSSGVQTSVSFGIKDSGLHHIFGILRNQLYSDKVLAVVREYSCNAVDAHVEAGCAERPIQVTLPTKLKLELKIRDFGPALSAQDIQDVYAFYGESTKRNTNNQIGMLGIGSKSAFAYGDNFVINSYIDGVEQIWNAFIDPSQVGQISKIGEQPTDKENGIEIVIPVKEEDVNEFHEKARDLFKFFKVTPDIKGAAQFEYSSKEALFEDEGWVWYKSNRDSRYGYHRGDCMAIMGNIAYPISTHDLNLSDEHENEGLHHLVCENLHLKFNIGDLDIAASREKLQLTDSTREVIIKRLQKVKTELVAKSIEQFSECESLWAAKVLLGDIRDWSSGLYELREILEKNVTWNGTLVESTSVSTPENVKTARLVKPRRSGAIRYRWEDDYGSINADSSVVVVENDLGHRRAIMGRVLEMAMDEKKQVNLVEFENAKGKKKWAEVYDGPMFKLSELEARPLSDFYGSSRSNGSSTHDSAHAKKLNSLAFEYDFDRDSSGWSSKSSDEWKAADVDLNDEGVYVIIDKFKLETPESGYGGSNPTRIKKLKEDCEAVGVKFPKHVYAWKIAKRGVPEQAEGFVTLWDYLKGQLGTFLVDNNMEQKFIDQSHSLDNRKEWHDNLDAPSMLRLLVAKDNLFATNIAKKVELLGSKKDQEKLEKVRELIKQFNIEAEETKKPSFDLSESNEKVLQKYSMLNLVDWYATRDYRGNSKNAREQISNYINVVDVCDASR